MNIINHYTDLALSLFETWSFLRLEIIISCFHFHSIVFILNIIEKINSNYSTDIMPIIKYRCSQFILVQRYINHTILSTF